ncbi:uncharacterized protein LOC132206819 isoform X1 [Stegostoma tigrinum]|uniref:uncharacterized protein LOC132206819 isoform X1 n=1 Tax=Stegostoma tigrinum TaxID=3053191 RepID=UPI0028706AC8|nr:uncharacterized protein LOC132206819 isoform X1 [Stegostoma tigrinum]
MLLMPHVITRGNEHTRKKALKVPFFFAWQAAEYEPVSHHCHHLALVKADMDKVFKADRKLKALASCDHGHNHCLGSFIMIRHCISEEGRRNQHANSIPWFWTSH